MACYSNPLDRTCCRWPARGQPRERLTRTVHLFAGRGCVPVSWCRCRSSRQSFINPPSDHMARLFEPPLPTGVGSTPVFMCPPPSPSIHCPHSHSYSTTAAMIGMPSSAVLHSEVQLLHRTEDKPAAVGDVHEGSALIPGSPDGVRTLGHRAITPAATPAVPDPG